jgi:hypothetical protein
MILDRVVVVGCAGSGKSALARKLSARVGLPLTERDTLGPPDSPRYREALRKLAGQPAWILDGAPYYEDDVVYSAADTLIFLDYSKPLVMWRVLRRTIAIELFRRPAGAHQPAGLRVWRDSEHPLRWAWTSHQDRHREGLELLTHPDLAAANLLHFTHPSQAERWIRQL